MAVSVGADSQSAAEPDAPKPAPVLELETVRSTRFRVATTTAPWELAPDALVVSFGPNGLGQLGIDLYDRFPALTSVSDVTWLPAMAPGAPHVVDVRERLGRRRAPPAKGAAAGMAALPFRFLVYATVREPGSPPDPRGSPPPTLEAIATACVAAVGAAADAGARSVALPILGTGIGGQDLASAAEAVFPKLRGYAEDRRGSPVDEIVFVVPDDDRARVIEQQWQQSSRVVQLRMLADGPIDSARLDLLDAGAFAQALAFVVDHPQTSTPLTIAINAPWGAGKTSLAKLLEERLVRYHLGDQEPIICWFNAWHHDDAPSIVSALASTVARAAAGRRSIWRRVLDPLPSRMLTPRGRRRRHVATALGAVAVGAITLLVSGTLHQLSTGSITFSAAAALATAAVREVSTVRGTASDIAGLVRAPDAAFATGSLEEVRADLGRLIHQATRRDAEQHSRLVVFIDDLERCLPARSIEVCETVSSLLSHEDVVVVLIGDIQTLATAAEAKYRDLAPRYRTGTLTESAGQPVSSFGELYLEKIIQFRFDMPTHDPAVLKSLATALIDSTLAAGPGATDVESAAAPRPGRSTWLGRLGRRLTERPKKARRQRHENDDLHTAVATGRAPASAQARERYRMHLLVRRLDAEYLDKSFQAIEHLVRPRPRDLKRLLNRTRFLLYIAKSRQLLEPHGPLEPAAIGKWALLAERWPDLVGAVSADPDVLGRLETQSTTTQRFVAAMGEVVPGYAHSGELWRLVTTAPKLGAHAACLSRLRRQDGVPDDPRSAGAG
jgi:hypothetical protein